MALGLDARLAAALVAAGWTPSALGRAAAEVLPWLAADASVHALLGRAATWRSVASARSSRR
jgi:hypothetical protein